MVIGGKAIDLVLLAAHFHRAACLAGQIEMIGVGGAEAAVLYRLAGITLRHRIDIRIVNVVGFVDALEVEMDLRVMNADIIDAVLARGPSGEFQPICKLE